MYTADRHDAARAGFDDAALYAEMTRAPAERCVPAMHMPHELAQSPFDAWQSRTDRVEY